MWGLGDRGTHRDPFSGPEIPFSGRRPVSSLPTSTPLVLGGGEEKSSALLRRKKVARSQGDSKGCPRESAGKQNEPQDLLSGEIMAAET